MSETAACLKCRSEIDTEASRCPECGYEPSARKARGRKWMIGLGGILTATVIGSVIGIPMILIGWWAGRRAAKRKPTTHAP